MLRVVLRVVLAVGAAARWSPTVTKSLVRAHVHVCVPLLLACTAYSRCRSLRRKGTDRIQQPAELRNKMKVSVRNVDGDL